MLNYRDALPVDVDLYYKWVNDVTVRQNSLNTKKIGVKEHTTWFNAKLKDTNVFMYVFFNKENIPVGQIIIERTNGWVSVSQSVEKEQRGKKYSSEILTRGTEIFLRKFPEETIVSVVRSTNIPSLKMSKNSGFNVVEPKSGEDQGKFLVLKGFNQNNEHYISKAKIIFNLIL